MWKLSFGSRLRTWTALAFISVAAGCSGGGSADVVVVSGPPPIAALAIGLTRVGPEAIQIDWSDNPYVAIFAVTRDGYTLARVNATTLIDASVLINQSYCYRVAGYDPSGQLIAVSDTACVTIFP